MKLCSTCRNTYPDDYQICPRDQALLTEVISEIVTGTVLRGKYEVLGVLGAGGMATVYKVRHKAFQELAAVKVVHPHFMYDPGFAKRFRNEAVVARQLKHPNAVRIDDFDYTEDGRPFIVMEYVEGRSLYEARQEFGGAWGVDHCLNIVMQAASALGAAHTLGIVHRDIKPSNILLLRSEDGSLHVKVLDFGIAKVSENPFAGMTSVNTQQSMIIGTPEYMSPEQAGGRLENSIDGRADLYSLGLVLYEMLTGAHPFKADTPMGMLIQQVHTAPAPPNSFSTPVSPAISALVLKSLQKDPKDRFQSAGEMLAAMRDPDAWFSAQVTPTRIQTQPAVQPSTAPPVFTQLNVGAPTAPPVRLDQAIVGERIAPASAPVQPKSKFKRYAVITAAVVLAAAMLSAAGVVLRKRTPHASVQSSQTLSPPAQMASNPKPSPTQTPLPQAPRLEPGPIRQAVQAPHPPVHAVDASEPESQDEPAASTRVKELIASGNRSLGNGRYNAAAVVFQGALNLDPNNAEAAAGLGQARAGLSSQGSAPANNTAPLASNSQPTIAMAPAGNAGSPRGSGGIRFLLAVLHFNGQVARGDQYTGPCPVHMQFGWFVMGAQPGVLSYRVTSHDGSHSSGPKTVMLQQANRPLPLFENWDLGSPSPQFADYSGWLELDVDSPSQHQSRVPFTIHCRLG